MVRAIVGANWGDEGKGKITDMMADQSDIVVRFQGGANAGHTIINDYGRFSLHLLPSGVFHQNIVNIIGTGVALDLKKLFRELDDLTAQGVPAPKILVSDRAQVLMPYHIQFDVMEEQRLGAKSFGSTKSGIAPFYSDKYLKIGIQVCELFEDEELMERLKAICEVKNLSIQNIYHSEQLLDPKAIFDEITSYRERLKPLVADTAQYLHQALRDGKNILLEGQLGTLKDTDHGIYPFVTSSSPLAGFGAVGAGVPPYEIKEVVTVTKAYSSAVGAGAFVSEIFGEEAEELRKRGGDKGEYGATTGRPRRVGWFDCVATKYGCLLQGATSVVMTNIDALGYLDKIPVCTGYEIDGEITTNFPCTPKLNRAKPVLTVLDGWKQDVRGIKNYNDLPENCRKYIEFLEEQIGFPIKMVSNGPKRSEIIVR